MSLIGYLHTVIIFFTTPQTGNDLQLLAIIVVFGTLGTYLVIIIVAILRLLKLVFVETAISRWAKPFVAPGKPGAKRILIVGDSTAVGAGAKKPEDTIAGHLAHDYPQADIANIGINGARTKLALKAMNAVAGQQFELVIVSVGGNDIWHFTSLYKLERDLAALLAKAKAVATGPVILLLYNNIGSSPIFPRFMRRSLKERGEEVHALFRRVAELQNIPCIELFSNENDNPFLNQPERFFSADGVHPSSEGYALWYSRMWRLLLARGYVF